jgi:G3E family GTPase
VQEQIAFADVILLNKVDLVTPGELDSLERRILKINAVARIHRTTNAMIQLDHVLNVKGFDLDRILEHEPDFLKNGGHKHSHSHHGEDHSHCDHEHGHCEHNHHHEEHDHSHCDHEHGHCEHETQVPAVHEQHDHVHDSSVSSVGLTVEGDLDAKKLNKWMSELLQAKGGDIFRMKGVLSIKGDPNRFVFQGVHMLFDGKSERPWGKTPRSNKLIFIGRNLDRDGLTEGLKNCLA